MSIDFETSAAENDGISSEKIAADLTAKLEESNEEMDTESLYTLKKMVGRLRDQLQTALVNELGEEEAILDETYDALFAAAAKFIEPPKQIKVRSFGRADPRSQKRGEDGGYARYS